MTNEEIRAVVTDEMLPPWLKWDGELFEWRYGMIYHKIASEVAEAAIVGHLTLVLAGHPSFDGVDLEQTGPQEWRAVMFRRAEDDDSDESGVGTTALAALAEAWRATR